MIHRLRRKRNGIQHKKDNEENIYTIINIAVISIIMYIICLVSIFYITTGRFYYGKDKAKVPSTIVLIPGGTFKMGDIQGKGDNNERPVHDVSLSSFKMSIYEITQGLYQSVMGSNPSYLKLYGDNYPVDKVSWYDAVKFCNKLSDKSGFGRCYDESTWECNFSKNGFRLPTEAEWEYACRAGTETKYYTGNSVSELGSAGWYGSNSGHKIHPIGQKEANNFGLYDMHGNVWEWCNDWYGKDYYSSSPSTNPTGPTSGFHRVMRGGSWRNTAEGCRLAVRSRLYPVSQYNFLGFRVVCRP